jgi:hypothetical protein
MGIIRNIIMYEIKSLYVILAAGKYFPNNIHRANYHFTHSKKLKKNRLYRRTTVVWYCVP